MKKTHPIISTCILAFVFSACGGDSGSNSSDNNVESSTSSSHDKPDYSGLTYKTFEGLKSEQPCDTSLNLTIAHIISTNEDYLCSQEPSSGLWSWQPFHGENGTDIEENGCIYETFTDSRDGHIYKMVTIGTQTWMAENLDFATNGSSCFVNSKTGLDECGLYNRGRFYLWSTAIDSAGSYSNNAKGCGSSVGKPITFGEECTPTYPMRGICPQGWHLPDTTEWRTLLNYTHGDLLLAKNNDNTKATNTFCFSALRLWTTLSEFEEGRAAIFWTSSIIWENKHTSGLHEAELFDSSQNLFTYGGTFVDWRMIPIRCIKDDNTNQPNSSNSNIFSSSSKPNGDYAGKTTLDKASNISVLPISKDYDKYELSISGLVKALENFSIDNLDFIICQGNRCGILPVSFKKEPYNIQLFNFDSDLGEIIIRQDDYGCGDFILRVKTYVSDRESTTYEDSIETTFNLKCANVQATNSTCTMMEKVNEVSLTTNGQSSLNFATGLSSNPDVTLKIEDGFPYFIASTGVKIMAEGSQNVGVIPSGEICLENFTEAYGSENGFSSMELTLNEWYLVKTSLGTYPFMVVNRVVGQNGISNGLTITYFKKK